LTTIQLIQFAIDSLSSVPFIYFWFNNVPCRGTVLAWSCANFLGISFFILFLQFYFSNYSKRRQQQQQQRKPNESVMPQQTRPSKQKKVE
jgi:hypothetical protein